MAVSKEPKVELEDPKNLYELCEQTVEAILASPTNYYQNDWACRAASVMPETKEVCGTAYCRAGWMQALLGKKRITAGDTAYRLLVEAGIPRWDVSELFNPICAATGYNAGFFQENGDEKRPGTKAYATAGANGLKQFMHTYERELRAARLVKDRSGRWKVEKHEK